MPVLSEEGLSEYLDKCKRLLLIQKQIAECEVNPCFKCIRDYDLLLLEFALLAREIFSQPKDGLL